MYITNTLILVYIYTLYYMCTIVWTCDCRKQYTKAKQHDALDLHFWCETKISNNTKGMWHICTTIWVYGTYVCLLLEHLVGSALAKYLVGN